MPRSASCSRDWRGSSAVLEPQQRGEDLRLAAGLGAAQVVLRNRLRVRVLAGPRERRGEQIHLFAAFEPVLLLPRDGLPAELFELDEVGLRVLLQRNREQPGRPVLFGIDPQAAPEFANRALAIAGLAPFDAASLGALPDPRQL